MKPLARGAWVISNWWGSFLKKQQFNSNILLLPPPCQHSEQLLRRFQIYYSFFFIWGENARRRWWNTFSLQNITLHVHVHVVLSVNLFSVLRNDFFVNPFGVDYTNNHWVITRLSKGVQIWTLTRKVRDGLLPSWDLNDGNGSGSCSNNASSSGTTLHFVLLKETLTKHRESVTRSSLPSSLLVSKESRRLRWLLVDSQDYRKKVTSTSGSSLGGEQRE